MKTNSPLIPDGMLADTVHSEATKGRFCSSRNLVFWLFPDINRKECRPLPACLYSWVQATFSPTDDQEEYADWQFSQFVYGQELDAQDT